MRKHTAIVIISCLILFAVVAVGMYVRGLRVHGVGGGASGQGGGLTQAISAFDYSNDRELVGASHYVFVGKVIEQVGHAQITNIIPETQYAVDVILNIKGELQGTVEITALGGESYQNGSTYVFATVYADELMRKLNQQQPIYGLFMGDSAKLVSADGNLSDAQLKTLADKNERVGALRKAYPNEILLDAEIKHNQTYNSYQSLMSGHLFTPPPFVPDQIPSLNPQPNESGQPIAPAKESASQNAQVIEPIASVMPSASPELTATPGPSIEVTASPEPSVIPSETPAPSPEISIIPSETPTPTLPILSPTPSE